jgi:hypothetical protein
VLGELRACAGESVLLFMACSGETVPLMSCMACAGETVLYYDVCGVGGGGTTALGGWACPAPPFPIAKV